MWKLLRGFSLVSSKIVATFFMVIFMMLLGFAFFPAPAIALHAAVGAWAPVALLAALFVANAALLSKTVRPRGGPASDAALDIAKPMAAAPAAGHGAVVLAGTVSSTSTGGRAV